MWAPESRAVFRAIAIACFLGYFSSSSLEIFSPTTSLLLLWINGMSKPFSGQIINCLSCNKEFYIPLNRIGIAKYCSRKCKDLYCAVKIKTNCKICDKEFEHISARCNKAKYCSRKCYYKSQQKKGTIIFKCHHCDKEFKGSPSDIGKRKYCSIQCVKKKNHAIWKPKFSFVRKAMKARGMLNSCKRCGYKEHHQILGVHHKDRNRKNNELSNLEILCPNCHSIEHMRHTPHSFNK